jgi:signal recognition particle receptor subunit beta
MFKLGIRIFDDKLRALPERSSALFISSPGIDPAPFAISTLCNVARDQGKAIYVVNNKPPASVRREADILGFDLARLEEAGRFVLVDSYSGFSGQPSGERFVVADPSKVEQVLATVERAGAEHAFVLLDSMSSFMDMHENGLEDFLRLAAELRKKASVLVLFSTWGYDPDCVRRVKSEFSAVLSLRPVEEGSIMRQFLFAERIGKEPYEKLAVPIKVLRPGGVRVYFPKVLITGPHRSGKSTMVRVMSTSAVSVDRMGTTVAMDYGYLDYKGFACDLYGTPGQELFDPILGILAEEAVAVVLVVNASDPRTFDRAKTMLVRTKARTMPLIVAANYSDGEEALPPDEVRHRLELPDDVPVVPTVAIEKKGIPELLDALIHKLTGVALAETRKEEGVQ